MPAGRAPQRGFTLLAALAALFVLALATERVVFVASQQAQRDREEDLLEAGADIARAIGAYHQASPGSVKHYPPSLADLTEDPRFLGVRRHLRRIPPDPMRPEVPWGLVLAPDGGVRGVHSTSLSPPLRDTAFSFRGLALPAATRHADWKFMHEPRPGAASGDKP